MPLNTFSQIINLYGIWTRINTYDAKITWKPIA